MNFRLVPDGGYHSGCLDFCIDYFSTISLFNPILLTFSFSNFPPSFKSNSSFSILHFSPPTPFLLPAETFETFETGIRKTVQWYLENQAWVQNVTSGAYKDWVSKQYYQVKK